MKPFADYCNYFFLLLRYSCIDTQYFLIKIPQESSREEASRGKGSIVVESVQQKIRVTRGSFASDAWEAEVAHDRKFSASVPTMAKLLSFTGLEKVKMAVIDLYRRIWLAHVRGAVGDDVPLNFRFVGNPGTGNFKLPIANCQELKAGSLPNSIIFLLAIVSTRFQVRPKWLEWSLRF